MNDNVLLISYPSASDELQIPELFMFRKQICPGKFSQFLFLLMPAPIHLMPIRPWADRCRRLLALEIFVLLEDGAGLVLVQVLGRDVCQHRLGWNVMNRDTASLGQLS